MIQSIKKTFFFFNDFLGCHEKHMDILALNPSLFCCNYLIIIKYKYYVVIRRILNSHEIIVDAYYKIFKKKLYIVLEKIKLL